MVLTSQDPQAWQQQFCRDSKRSKKERKTEEEMGRQHQGMRFGDSMRAGEDSEGWKGIVAMSSVVLRRPPRLRD